MQHGSLTTVSAVPYCMVQPLVVAEAHLVHDAFCAQSWQKFVGLLCARWRSATLDWQCIHAHGVLN
jgi:hypothetical protein